MKKKNEYVITVGFNKNDPDHREVAKLLNRMNRTKAQYIVKAVLAYEDIQKGGAGTRTADIDYEKVREYILKVIEEHETKNERSRSVDTAILAEKGGTEVKETVETAINEDELQGIMMSLQSFRQ